MPEDICTNCGFMRTSGNSDLYLVSLTTGGGGANAVVRADGTPTIEDGEREPVLRFRENGDVVAEFAMEHLEGWWKAVDE